MLTDIEIAQNTKLTNIEEIAKSIGLSEDDLDLYGKYKAKITLKKLRELQSAPKKGKLILVTAITPTPAGEGKSTMSIALADGIRKIGKKSCLALREPSLGPCFGIKGGACGGGYAYELAPVHSYGVCEYKESGETFTYNVYNYAIMIA